MLMETFNEFDAVLEPAEIEFHAHLDDLKSRKFSSLRIRAWGAFAHLTSLSGVVIISEQFVRGVETSVRSEVHLIVNTFA